MKVATSTLHSDEMATRRDSINWSFLPADITQQLQQRFVKTVAKKAALNP